MCTNTVKNLEISGFFIFYNYTSGRILKYSREWTQVFRYGVILSYYNLIYNLLYNFSDDVVQYVNSLTQGLRTYDDDNFLRYGVGENCSAIVRTRNSVNGCPPSRVWAATRGELYI